MFKIGLWEIFVIGLVAIVFVRPNELPKLFKTLGQFFGQVREFKDSVVKVAKTIEQDIESEKNEDKYRTEEKR